MLGQVYWLVFRSGPDKQAFGIMRYLDGNASIDKWWGRASQLNKEYGTGNWSYNEITQAEWETYRDLHELPVIEFGEEK